MDASAIVRRMDKDQARIVAMGVAAARRESLQIRTMILQAYARGRTIPKVGDILRRELLPTMADAMTALNIRGRELARDLFAESRVAMSTPLQRVLDRMKDPKLVRSLRKQYDVQALRIMGGVGDKIETKVRQTLARLVEEGANVRTGLKELNKSFDALGLTPKNSYTIENLFRTQSQIAYNAGRWQADQDEDIQEALWGYEYSTVGDDRVRPQHVALDGMRLPKRDPAWKTFWPPNGYSCRCAVIPVYDTVKIKRPPRQLEDGTPVEPDKGFALNFGEALV